MKANLGISVIICCYNSAHRLPETLRHLALQIVPEHIKWEIIVIDNASDDNTAETAKIEWEKHRLSYINFQVLHEPVPGKSHALQLGVDTSIYEFILICDDDNWLNNNYIYEAYQTIFNDNSIGAASGQGIAVTEVPPPDWFLTYQYAYAVGKQNVLSGDLSLKKYIWGAGMIFRKSIYLNTYTNMPSFLTGPNKDSIARGEDVEFCMRILLLNYKLYYNENMIYRHYIPKGRLTEEYKVKLLTGYEYENKILNLYAKLLVISKLSITKKIVLFLQSAARFSISKLGVIHKWNPGYESEAIYFLTKKTLQPIPIEIIELKKLFDQLTTNKNLQVEDI